MQNQQRYIFHIGLPKAASTTLQKKLFPFVPGINNLSLYPTNNVAGSNEVPPDVKSVYLNDKRLFEFYKALHNRPDISTEQLAVMWAELSREHEHFDVTLFSHEAITSAFFSAIPVSEKLQRINALFPCHIVIVIREHRAWLHSQYSDHPFDPLNFGGGVPCSFDSWVKRFLSEPALAAAREALQYDQLYDNCCRIFGKNNVTILRLEWLQNKPELFYQPLAELLGVDQTFVADKLSQQSENRGLSAVYNKLRHRQRKHLLAGLASPQTNHLLEQDNLKLLPKAQYQLSPATEASLAAYYADANHHLKVKMGW